MSSRNLIDHGQCQRKIASATTVSSNVNPLAANVLWLQTRMDNSVRTYRMTRTCPVNGLTVTVVTRCSRCISNRPPFEEPSGYIVKARIG